MEKETALIKLMKVRTIIGQTKVARSYPQTLSPRDFPKNLYTILSYSFDENMKKIGQTRDPEESPVSSADPNAHYFPDRNTLIFPIAILQPPIFHGPNVHPARNFGAIGSIIGHELTHVIDVKGSLYDGDGNNIPWWDPTKPDFKSRSECFEEQYSAFNVKGRNVNGTLTLIENIADNAGVTLAWDAYRKYQTTVISDTDEKAKKIGDKMFFIAYGQMWCERVRDKIVDDRLNWKDRSPGYWRLNGVVMNNKNFAKVFECDDGTPMNPKTKCSLWE